MERHRETGEAFLEYFVSLAGLKPDHRVLEVGCGIGRMAVPLARYLTRGSYEGFDVLAEGVRWCQRNVGRLHPSFRFQVARVFNGMYSPQEGVPASAYRFPFEEEQFDLVLATSVFTHMLPADVDNYVAESARVLKRGGSCFATFFLVTPESERLIATGKSSIQLSKDHGEFLSVAGSSPEAAIGYREAHVRQMFERHGLGPLDVRYGGWCGRSNHLDYQDIVVAAKGTT